MKNTYHTPWIYREKEFIFDEKMPYEAFVYSITCPDGKKYIGKKSFFFMRKKSGAKRRSKIQSDWQRYYGSAKEIKDLVKTSDLSAFKREILHLCITKGESTYLETKEQFKNNVLEDENYINDNILGKFFSERVRTWKEKQIT